MNKPPLGVTPHFIFYRNRMESLARAIYEHLEFIDECEKSDRARHYKAIGKWSEELAALAGYEANEIEEG